MRERNSDESGRVGRGEHLRDERSAERDIEDKYLRKLEEPRDSFAAKRIDDMADRLSRGAGTTPELIREAFHLWRAKDPQPETHRFADQMQARLSEDKNLAFALLLRRVGVEPNRTGDRVRSQDGEDGLFAKAVRGSVLSRFSNWGERPDFPKPEKPAPPPQFRQVHIQKQSFEPLSPSERKALENLGNGPPPRDSAVRVRALGPGDSREDYFVRKYEMLQRAPGGAESVDRDLAKLRKVPGLGDPAVVLREFEKADDRFRLAVDDAERAKAFTRAMALSLLVLEGQHAPKPIPTAPPRTIEVSDRDLVIDEAGRIGQERQNADGRMKDRQRANSEEERLGESVAAEMFAAQRYVDNPELMAQVRAAEARYASNPDNADYLTLARQHETLIEREVEDDFLVERIALAGLAQRQHYAQHRLEFRVAEDAVVALRSAPSWERDGVRTQALVLMEVEQRGERPFADDLRFVKRELLHRYEENEETARVLAVLHQVIRSPVGSLADDARWEPAVSQRVQAEGDRVLLDQAKATDARLQRELTEQRLAAVIAPTAAERDAALIRAQEVALLLEDLPGRRSLEIDTK